MDDLEKLGVAPSDRKKLESMGITKLDQIALLTHQKLGLGRSKGETLIRRTRNILASQNLTSLDIMDDRIIIEMKTAPRPVIKSVMSILGVYDVAPGSTTLEKKGNRIVLHRKSRGFDHIIETAEIEKSILEERQKSQREKKGITLAEDDIVEFGKKRGFKGFWENVFQDIKGNDIMKKILSVSMFSTYSEPVHSLIVGEPGSSKTMAKETIEQNFKDITSIGANTTRAGLVCHLGTGDLGALAYSDNRLILVDEFDKIPDGDIEYCYELLSNGRCSIHSAKVHQNIQSCFIMIAFANPSSQVFGDRPLADIPLPPLLISRFALIVKTENIGKQERLDLFRQKFYGKGEIEEKPLYYDQWLNLARFYTPEIEASEKRINQYLDNVNDIVEDYYSTELRRDLRMGDYIVRVPKALARASFSSVTDKTLEESEIIFKESIESWL
jgi:DNA replicative helicase MCM subunit Mcm2 (Cdc46/Mcm family)